MGIRLVAVAASSKFSVGYLRGQGSLTSDFSVDGAESAPSLRRGRFLKSLVDAGIDIIGLAVEVLR
jgi:hypothetical protein